jgi:hypothetical protein
MTDRWHNGNYREKMERMGISSYDKYRKHYLNEKFRTKENLDRSDLRYMFTKDELTEIILELYKKPKYVSHHNLNNIMLGFHNLYKERKKRELKLRTKKLKEINND